MITTDDPDIAESCRVIRQHGMRRRYYHDELGFNFRMTDIHAAIGYEQLKKLDSFNTARRANARYISEHVQGVIVPTEPEGYDHVFHQYTIRVENERRDNMLEYLAANGVGSGVYYPVPIHKQTYYMKDLGYNESFPVAEEAAAEVLSLPVHPGLNKMDLDKIISTVNEFWGE